MSKKSCYAQSSSQQSLLSTSVMNEYLVSLQDKRRKEKTNEFGINSDSADQILDSSNQRAFFIAIDRFSQIKPSRGAWFLSENTELFLQILSEAITDWELIDESLDLGMAQTTIEELFSIRARNLSLLTGKAISKTSNRTRMSDNTEVLITTELLNQIKANNSVFSTREFVRLMIRISLMITGTGAIDEARIAPIIVFIYNEQFPFKIVSQKRYWLNDEPTYIDLSPKREQRKKQTKSCDKQKLGDNNFEEKTYLEDF